MIEDKRQHHRVEEVKTVAKSEDYLIESKEIESIKAAHLGTGPKKDK